MAGLYLRQVVDTGCVVFDRATSAKLPALPGQFVELLARPAEATDDWQVANLYDDDETHVHEVWIREKFLEPIDPAIVEDDFVSQCVSAAQAFGANQDFLVALARYITGCKNVAPLKSSGCGPYLLMQKVWDDALPGAADLDITSLDRMVPTMQPFIAAANAAKTMAAFRQARGDTGLPTETQLTFVHLFGLQSADVLIHHLADAAGVDPSIDTVLDTFCTAELQGTVDKLALAADLLATKPNLLGSAAKRLKVSEVLAVIEADLTPHLQTAAQTVAKTVMPPTPVAPPPRVPSDVAPLPASNAVPFAAMTGAPEQAFWPVLTADPQAMLVSYLNTAGQIVGLSGRRFFADRLNGARHHVGMDIFCREHDVVIALADGRVVDFFFFYKTSTGEESYALLVEHAGVVVNYGEVKKNSSQEFGWHVGDAVKAGQRIGRVSSTNMIHFETYVPGTKLTSRWMTNGQRPPSLLNPTMLLLTLAARGKRLGVDGTPAPAPKPGTAQVAKPTPGSTTDLLTLARTVYGEARGEIAKGREAVAHVVLNRVGARQFPKGVADVCLQPSQFSCWNPGDPNRQKISSLLPGASTTFDQCYAAAEQVLRGLSADMTDGATHYYAKYIATPKWVTNSPNAKMTIEIGAHRFYKGIK